MNSLIRFIAELFANFLERGSLWGAALGAAIGAVSGFVIANVLNRNDLLDRYWVGAAIAMAIVLAIPFAAVGSRLLPHDLPARGPDVVLTNLNYALIAPFVLVLIGGITAYVVQREMHQHHSIEWLHPGFLALNAVLLILAVVSIRTVLAVRVGTEIVFYRAIGKLRFPRERLRHWGFEVSRGRYTRVPPPERVLFELELRDGPTFQTVVSPVTASRLADVLGETRVSTRSD
jgi:hypothetical protein